MYNIKFTCNDDFSHVMCSSLSVSGNTGVVSKVVLPKVLMVKVVLSKILMVKVVLSKILRVKVVLSKILRVKGGCLV